MFAYCLNNPVNAVDPKGFFPSLGEMWETVKGFFNDTFGVTTSESITVEYTIIPDPLPITASAGTTYTTTYGDMDKPIIVNFDKGESFIDSSINLSINFSVLGRDFSYEQSLGLSNIGIRTGVGKDGIIYYSGGRVDLSRFRAGIENSSTYTNGQDSTTVYSNCNINPLALAFCALFGEGSIAGAVFCPAP